MTRLNMSKSPDEILQEEFLQERAAVLGRAGDSVSHALEKLRRIERRIETHLSRLEEMGDPIGESVSRHQAIREINGEINRYNRAREHAMLRYYYLIVTREAMGMRRHQWVEKHYAVPPRRRHLQDF